MILHKLHEIQHYPYPVKLVDNKVLTVIVRFISSPEFFFLGVFEECRIIKRV